MWLEAKGKVTLLGCERSKNTESEIQDDIFIIELIFKNEKKIHSFRP
jgi:hypothetical protein